MSIRASTVSFQALRRPNLYIRSASIFPHQSYSQMSARAQSQATKPNTAEQAHHQIIDDVNDFDGIQATRPTFDHSNEPIVVTKHPNPSWKYGHGVVLPKPTTSATSQQQEQSYAHIEIDPYASDRPMIHNYRLLISGIAPRPIGLMSTVDKEGNKNLAPMSYFQVVEHDPPMFIVGFSSRRGRPKDTFVNLKETGECVINTVSEQMIEAVNATSIDAPYGVSEWNISGLTEEASSTVKPSRVKESVFSIEGKVEDIKEFKHGKGEENSVAGVVMIKAKRFWVREDAANEDVSHIDLNVLRPLAQLGGMSYGRITSTFEVPRKKWKDEVGKSDVLAELDSARSDKVSS